MATLPRLFIDKLVLTIDVSEQRRALVQDQLSNASEPFYDNLTNPAPRGRYRYRYELTVPNGEVITIQSQPASASHNYLKLEYSPERIGSDGAGLLATYLNFVLGPQFRQDFYQGHVDRIDITFDVHRLRLDDLWIQDLRNPGKTSAVIRGGDLQCETLYFGYGTTRQLIVYDKNTERGRPRSNTAWLRFEYRYAKGDYQLYDLYSHLSNPFSSFIVRRFAPLALPATNLHSRLLFDTCRLSGASKVLDYAAPEEREALRAMIESFPYWRTWSRRTTLWSQLRSRISELIPESASL